MAAGLDGHGRRRRHDGGRAGWRAAALLALAWSTGSCTTRVAMSELESANPDQPHSTILYSGIRDTVRRFPDYSVVDRKILKRSAR